jgi:toxin ParE1/3/4
VFRLRITESAATDLSRIIAYISEEGSLTVARHFVDELRARCRSLAALDFRMGRDRSEVRPGVRGISRKSYIIFFDYPDAETLRVLRIIHGARDLPQAFHSRD